MTTGPRTREERELEELRAIGQFKAHPLNGKVGFPTANPRLPCLHLPCLFCAPLDPDPRLARAAGVPSRTQIFEGVGEAGVPRLRKLPLTEPQVRPPL